MNSYTEQSLQQFAYEYCFLVLEARSLRSRTRRSFPARGTRSAKRFARKSTSGCGRRTRSTRSSISIGHCAIRTNRPGCCPSTIAAITFTRATSAIARWAMRSISHCSRRSHEPCCSAHDSSRRRVEHRARPRRRNHRNLLEEEVTHQSSRSQVSKELGIQLHAMLVENGL